MNTIIIAQTDQVIEKIKFLTKTVPGWAKKASEKMNLQQQTIRAIAKGDKGATKDRQIELLEVLIGLDNERNQKIKNLIK